MDFAAYERYGVGDLKLRLDEDVEKLNDFAKLQTSDWVIAYLTMMVTGIALFVMNWQLALMSMAIVPITFFMGRAIGKGERALNEQRRKVNGERDNWLSNSLAGWKEVKALNLEKHEHISFVRYIHKTALIDAKWVYEILFVLFRRLTDYAGALYDWDSIGIYAIFRCVLQQYQQSE
jgi:ABC-type bacteriocin/lantibiotic exporter with double-glycine peptidase domain